MKQTIAIVYLQAKLPKYAEANLKYLSILFPRKEIYLITDNLENIRTAISLGVKSFKVEGMNELWNEVTNVSVQPINFREGFWISSLIRFKAIEKFMQHNSVSQLIQIEADVILMPNFPFEKIAAFSGPISFPLVSKSLGAASIFVVNNLESIANFNSRIEKLIQISPSHSDMTVLALVANQYPELVSILPTLPNYIKPATISSTDIYMKMSSNFEYFDGVFDAATLGMYFFGTDARNNRGLKKIGINFDTHSIKTDGFRIIRNRNGRLQVDINENKFGVYNLHLHSKNLWLFNHRTQAIVIFMYQFFHLLQIRRLFSAKIFCSLVISKICRIWESKNEHPKK